MVNLILIPKINAQAATYPATTSFTYNYQGYDYQFYFSGEVSSPQDYRFDSSVLDYLITKASEGINLSISSGLGAKIDWVSGIVLSSVFDFYRNFVVATDKVIADWIVWSDIYGFTYSFTGIDSNYPGHETYGDAYGWRFTGWLGENIDLVLDSQGMLYGSNPIGNYTFSDNQEEFGQWSIHQHDGDDIWMPSVYVPNFNDLDPPYFEGNTLVFFAYNNGVKHRFTIPNFQRCICAYYPWNSVGSSIYPGQIGFLDTTEDRGFLKSDRLYVDGVKNNFSQSGNNVTFTYHGNYTYNAYFQRYFFDYDLSLNLPMYKPDSYNSYNYGTILNGNTKGVFNNQPQFATCELLYLDILTTSPLPDLIVLPVDDPIPVSDIQPDPVDFTPDPDDEPDPVPGVDYPGDDPQPVPVPPLPPLVSGNDDLWPDMNEVFAIESDMDSYLGGLSNFQFTPLRTLVEGFSSSLMWVSTIMMALYNGSDFSVLFVVLSIFFIAAALLGIYKWWTH